MSWQAVDAVMTSSATAGADRLVLLAIAWRANKDTAECWPAVPTIAADATVSERQVTRSVRVAVELGELEAIPRAGGAATTDPRYRPTLYRLKLPGVTRRHLSGVTSRPPRGDRVSPRFKEEQFSEQGAAAREELMARDRRRREGRPDCSTCEDLGTVEGPDGLRDHCPDCTPGAA